jgi:hypothetical protein
MKELEPGAPVSRWLKAKAKNLDKTANRLTEENLNQ